MSSDAHVHIEDHHMTHFLNRRAFHKLAGSVAALCMVGLGGVAVSAAPSHSTRLRWVRRKNIYQFWVRVTDTYAADAPVPFTLQVSTDALFRSVLRSKSFVVSSDSANIARTHFILSEFSDRPTPKLFVRLLVGTENAASRVWPMGAA
jgi:hypothetical protein